MTASEKQTTARQELDWLAFQYVANELSDDERAGFEARLADDPAACEAIAAAVELTQTLVAAEKFADRLKVEAARPALPDSRANWLRRVVWMATGALVCLALVISWQSVVETSRFAWVKQRVKPSDAGLQALAVAWSETRDDFGRGDSPVTPAGDETSSQTDDDSGDDDSDEGGDEAGAVPSWLVTAVSDLAKQQDLIEK